MHQIYTGPAVVMALVLASAPILAAASGGPPKVNIDSTCKASEVEVRKLFGNDTAVTVASCLTQQKAAFEQMMKDWSTYPTADKANCVQQGYMPSYVEWLTCFEIQRQVRKIKVEDRTRETPPPARRRNTRNSD